MAEPSDSLAAEDVLEFRVSGYVAADPFMNVLHYQLMSVPTGANVLEQLESMAVAFSDGVIIPYQNMLPTDGRITGIKVVRINNPGSPTWTQGVVANGLHTGDYLPVEDAIVFKKRTLGSGIGQAGLLYMPAITEAINIGDYVDVGNGLVVAMVNALQAKLMQSSTEVAKPVVWSRKTLIAPGESRDVVQVGINARISHQRRRKPRF